MNKLKIKIQAALLMLLGSWGIIDSSFKNQTSSYSIALASCYIIILLIGIRLGIKEWRK